ncbi:D-arabinono-1,4-lactone oxidase [Lithohypha guttulata]|nr:D-arabinono-1,4-lactone oxidase [Lithohypha guttulata]
MTDWAAPNLPTTKPNKPFGKDRLTPANFSPRLSHELARIDDDIPFRPKARYLHHTWAQTFFSRPEYYFQPESVAELQKIVTLARRCHKRVCVTGFGHSPSTLTLTSSWLVNLDNISNILEWDVDGKKGLVRFEAGISLHNLNQQLAAKGLTLPNLGSIDVQSLAGSISTGTHGSSLSHGLLSQSVTSMTILLSNAQLVTCSPEKNVDLFRAALLSLGALGIIVEMTYQTVPDFNIHWSQRLVPLDDILSNWSESFWKQREFTRVWWLPYLKRAVIWSANKTDEPPKPPNKTFYGGAFGYYLYHNLLALSNYIPSILPFVEWLIFGMQYGFKPDTYTMTAIEPARSGLLMDCLYSQWVNEWALPLPKGPEAISRLSAWINGAPQSEHNIPFSNKNLYVHCPVEVRVSDTTTDNQHSKVHPFLDPTWREGPTLYLNATLYRPYGKDPPCRDRYYEAFEYLMRELGGRPHWAKNFLYTDREHISTMYADDMQKFLAVRNESDPDGMFLGQWHLNNLPIESNNQDENSNNKQSSVEEEISRKPMGLGWGDGVLWEGAVRDFSPLDRDAARDAGVSFSNDDGGNTPTAMSMTSRTSEESFDMLAKGEASFYRG